MPKGLNTPQCFQVGSFAVTVAANSGNLRTAAATATARAIPISDCVSLVLNSLTLTSEVTARLDVYLQHSWDGGTTWTIAEHFAAVTTSTDQQTLTFRTNGLGSSESAVRNSTTTSTAAVIAQNIVLAPDQRIAWTVSGTNNGGGTLTPTATFTVNAICQPFGTAGV